MRSVAPRTTLREGNPILTEGCTDMEDTTSAVAEDSLEANEAAEAEESAEELGDGYLNAYNSRGER